jgi:hypothetical protein
VKALEAKAGKNNMKYVKAVENIDNTVKKLIDEKQKLMKGEENQDKTEKKDEVTVENLITEWQKQNGIAVAEIEKFKGALQSGNVDARTIETEEKAFKLEFHTEAELAVKIFKAQEKEINDRIEEIKKMEVIAQVEVKISRWTVAKEKALASLEKSLRAQALADYQEKQVALEKNLENKTVDQARKVVKEHQKALTEKQKIIQEEKVMEGMAAMFG